MRTIRSLRFPRLLLFLIFSNLVLSSVSWRPSVWTRRTTITFPSNQDPTVIHSHFMNLALDQARHAAAIGEVPIGAVLVQEVLLSPPVKTHGSPNSTTTTTTYRILAKAGNRVESQSDASAHAELQVLRSGAKRGRNWRLPHRTTLYSTLEPCPMCLAACQAFRLPTLVYGAPDLRLGAVETHLRLLDVQHPYHNISTVISGVGREDSAALLQDFFRKRRREQKEQVVIPTKPRLRWRVPWK
jgi:tRNA(adenine34) deaminase